jgi:predicted ribosome quality control (RQC) complex YloA/Tae2 family protein
MNEAEPFKSLNYLQLKSWAQLLDEKLRGAQLQDVWCFEEGLVLEVYLKSEFNIVIDLKQQSPAIVLLENARPRFKKQPKPVSLYMKAHVENARIAKIQAHEGFGRVLVIDFVGKDHGAQLLVELIPKAANVSVSREATRISFYKPRELKLQPEVTAQLSDTFSAESFLSSWLQSRFAQTTSKVANVDKWKVEKQKILGKKVKALEALDSQSFLVRASALRAFGESAKGGSPNWDLLEVSEQESLKKASPLIVRSFEMAKLFEGKEQGRIDRIEILKSEIAQLRLQIEAGPSAGSEDQVEHKEIKPAKVKVSTRKIEVSNFVAYMGKSATDNLKLLRSARAWDIWIHLKDFPSSHAILKKEKAQVVPDAVIREVSQWLIKESLRQRAMVGEKYAIIYSECRYVRPIKGDKIGRVNYQNERSLLVTYS